MAAYCQACGADIDIKAGDIVGRGDTCPRCRADLHACVHCGHYDPKAYNQCHEPQAERVDDRVKANFCEYFSIRTTRPATAGTAGVRASEARARLDALFKKPSV